MLSGDIYGAIKTHDRDFNLVKEEREAQAQSEDKELTLSLIND